MGTLFVAFAFFAMFMIVVAIKLGDNNFLLLDCHLGLSGLAGLILLGVFYHFL